MSSDDPRLAEARHYCDLARAACGAQDWERAKALLQRSLDIYDTAAASDLLSKVEAKLRNSRSGASSSSSSSTSSSSYSSQQAGPEADEQGGMRRRHAERARQSSRESEPERPKQTRSEYGSSSSSSSYQENIRRQQQQQQQHSHQFHQQRQSSTNHSQQEQRQSSNSQSTRAPNPSSKDLYSILGVSRTATEAEIKAAYRKLALQYHPDRNPAPEAEEMFKKLTHAYGILSDPNKRRIYDQTGSDDGQTPLPRTSRAYAGGMGGYRAESPEEEFFRMFFGTGGLFRGMHAEFEPQFQTRRQYRRGTTADSSNNATFFGQILHLLPLLALLLFSMVLSASQSSYSSTGQTPFSLHQTNIHSIQRVTPMGTSYFVGRQFDYAYGRDAKSLAQIEAQVEEEYISALRKSCEFEGKQRQKAIEDAKQKPPEYRAAALQAATERKTPSCEKLRKRLKIDL